MGNHIRGVFNYAIKSWKEQNKNTSMQLSYFDAKLCRKIIHLGREPALFTIAETGVCQRVLNYIEDYLD